MTVTITDETNIPGAQGKELITLPMTEDGSLDMELVTNILDNLRPDQALMIRAREGAVISGDVFRQVAGQDKTVIIAILDDAGKVLARFVFNGQDIRSPADLDLSFSNEPGAAAYAAAAADFPKDTKMLFLRFGHSGPLPGKATVSVLACPPFSVGDGTFLYSFSGPGYDYLSAQAVDASGYASFPLEHCSEYILTDQKIKDAPGGTGTSDPPPESGGSTKEAGATPKTGDQRNLTLWIVLASGAAAYAAAAALPTRKRKKATKK